MKLYLSENLVALKENFEVKDDNGVAYEVKSHWVSVGKKMDIIDVRKREKAAVVDEVKLTILPKCIVKLSSGEKVIIKKKITFIEDGYKIKPYGWKIKGDIFNLKYTIHDNKGDDIAYISKRLVSMSDSYVIEIVDESVNPVIVLSVVLAIDIVSDREEEKRNKKNQKAGK